MTLINRIIGIWMVIAGTGLFVFANMLEPYMDTLSGITLYVLAIPAVILIAAPTGALIALGIAQATGAITIRVEGGK